MGGQYLHPRKVKTPLKMEGEPLKGSPHCTLSLTAGFSPLPLSLPSSESVSRFSLFLPRSLCLCLGIYFSIPLYLLFPSVSQNLLSAPLSSLDRAFCLCVFHSFPSLSLSLFGSLCFDPAVPLYLPPPALLSSLPTPLSSLPAPRPDLLPHNFSWSFEALQEGEVGDGGWRGREGKFWWGKRGSA